MSWQGDYNAGTIVAFTFTTVGTQGLPTALLGGPSVLIYQNALSSGAAAGVSLAVNFASTTGLNSVSIDTSQDIVFYAAGKDYSAVVAVGTVSGTSVAGYTIGSFSLNNRSIRANVVQWGSATVAVPATAGIPDVNTKNIQNVAAATSLAGSNVNVVSFNGVSAATSLALGNVNVTSWLGTLVTAATAGIPDVNSKNIANTVAATSLAGANVNVVSFNGTSTATSLALGNVNVVEWLGAAVTAAAAGIPDVNAKNIANTAAVTSLALGNVNLTEWLGVAPAVLAGSGGNLVQTTVSGAGAASNVNVTQWGGVAVAGSLPPDSIFTPGQAAATLQSGSSATTVTLVSGSSNIVDFYKFQAITLKSGLGTGQTAIITNYNPVTKVAILNAGWAQNPSGGDAYFLIGEGQAVAGTSGVSNVNVTQWVGGVVPAPNVTGEPLVDVNHWRGTQPNTLVSNRVDSSVGGMQAGVIVATAYAAGAMTTVAFATNFLTGALIDPTGGNAIGNDTWDLANGIESGVTPRQALRYAASSTAGKLTGAQTGTVLIQAIGNGNTNRITATTDQSGNRQAITLN